jgi:2-methylcitrate dehydratase PrpD
MQYAVARALVDRAVRLEHFEGRAHFDPVVRDLMARTEARPHPDMPDASPLQWGAEVAVTMRDGQRLASRLDDFERRGPGGLPMSTAELWEKFEDCAKRALPRGNIAPLFDLLSNIEALGGVAELTMLLERHANERPAAATVRAAEMPATAMAGEWVP